MPSKPFELALAVAKAFARHMRVFHAEENSIKRDEIASRQLHVLRSFPREKPLRLADVKEMFEQMKDGT